MTDTPARRAKFDAFLAEQLEDPVVRAGFEAAQARVTLTDAEIDRLVFAGGPDGDHDAVVATVEQIVTARLAAVRAQIKAEGAAEVRDDIRARWRIFNDLEDPKAAEQYLNALQDCWGLANNRARIAGGDQ